MNVFTNQEAEDAVEEAKEVSLALTRRERQLVRLVAVSGLNYAETARKMFMTVGSVNVLAHRVAKKIPGPGDPRVKMTRLGTILNLVGEL